ncbi:MAG: beta-L-arabinofuranosidase domain-containing protein, partial [Aeoliella sp.]
MKISPKLLLSVGIVLIASQRAHGETSISVLSRPDVATRNSHYVSNREPLVPSALVKLPIGAVKARGWLHESLLRQRNGLTGKLPEISAWLEKDGNAWLSADGRGKWGWEEVPYWLRGSIRLGKLLEDQELIDETEIWLSMVFEGQRENGHFGPLRVFGDDDSQDMWANMLMLSCLQTYYEYSQDPRVLDLMSKYFRFQLAIPDEEMFTHFWQFYRGGDNLESVYWLYNQTGEKWLLDLAEKVHRNTANWRQAGDLPNWHSVNVAQAFGEPATYHLQSRDPDDLAAAYQNFALVRRRFGQVPGGMFGADENARIGYDDPRQAIETCAVVEQMTSDEVLLGITGDTFWADHVEEVAFNTLPAAFTQDYRALRYLTSPNLATSDRQDHAPGVENIGPMFVMNPLSHRCCQHNHSLAWPRFVEHLWMATPDNGLCAALYGPSIVNASVGEGATAQIEEVTRYPFEEQVVFKIDIDQAASFPLYLRIP